MTIFDSSVVIAFFLGEPGAARAADEVAGGGFMATINLGEVSQKLARRGAAPARVRAALAGLPLTYVDLDEASAIEAGALISLTQPAGLSIADRCCLVLARKLGGRALTADRAWPRVADAVGVRVELIR